MPVPRPLQVGTVAGSSRSGREISNWCDAAPNGPSACVTVPEGVRERFYLPLVRFLDHIDRGAIGDLLGRDEYFWLDLDAPDEGEIDPLEDLFHFHPLALEDLRKKGQRPKLEDFDQYMFLVYYGAREDTGAEVELQEVHAFLSGDYIITTHSGKIAALEEARQHLSATAP